MAHAMLLHPLVAERPAMFTPAGKSRCLAGKIDGRRTSALPGVCPYAARASPAGWRSTARRGTVSIGGMIEPFTLAVPDAELEDLRTRLLATRWPEPATDPRQGVALERLQGRCARWAQDYDWRATERRLNAVPQFTTTIDGLQIHFLHARAPRADTFPLVLTHGWPGSVVEFLDVLPLLTEAGFHCVVPSLPGYGWSGKPTGPGWGVARTARAWGDADGSARLRQLRRARHGLGNERDR
jgi:hypothetical protein